MNDTKLSRVHLLTIPKLFWKSEMEILQPTIQFRQTSCIISCMDVLIGCTQRHRQTDIIQTIVTVWQRGCRVRNNLPWPDTGHCALDWGAVGCPARCSPVALARRLGPDGSGQPGLEACTRTAACTYWTPSSPPLLSSARQRDFDYKSSRPLKLHFTLRLINSHQLKKINKIIK